MKDLGLLALRLAAGGLLAGHGAQKLFGWFGGHGPAGTAGWLESMGLRPGRSWALAAGLSEFGGGLVTALGLLNPLGPVSVMAAMAMAWGKAHWGKPIWATSGGAELPLLNLSIMLALTLGGPGRFSLDRALRLRPPWWLVAPVAIAAAAVTALGLASRPAPAPAEAIDEAERAEPAVAADPPAAPVPAAAEAMADDEQAPTLGVESRPEQPMSTLH